MERVGSERREVQIMRMPQNEEPAGVARKRVSSSERTVNMLGGVSWVVKCVVWWIDLLVVVGLGDVRALAAVVQWPSEPRQNISFLGRAALW